MTKRAEVLGAVLAGGKSTRMGADKALLPLKGVPLIQYAAMALSGVFTDVVVVADEVEKFEFLRLSVIPDLLKHCGPLGGIHAALHHSGGRSVFILSCDTPFVSSALIEYILDFKAATSTRIALMHDELHPLCGLYGHNSLPVVETNIARGMYKALETLAGIKYTAVPITPNLPFYDHHLLHNVNTPDEYHSIADGGISLASSKSTNSIT